MNLVLVFIMKAKIATQKITAKNTDGVLNIELPFVAVEKTEPEAIDIEIA